MTLRTIKKRNIAWKKSLAALVGLALLGSASAMAEGTKISPDDSAVVQNDNGIGIGKNVKVYADQGIAVGEGVEIGAPSGQPGDLFGVHSYAIGRQIRVWTNQSVAIGQGLNLGTSNNVKPGIKRAWQTNNVVLGYNTTVDKGHVISIGSDNVNNGQRSVSIGNNLTVNGTGGDTFNVAIGNNITADHNRAIGIGYKVESGAHGVVIGEESKTTGTSAVALGKSAEASKLGVAIGNGAKAKNWNGVAIGNGAVVEQIAGTASVAIGQGTVANSVGAVVMGLSAKTEGNRDNIAIGTNTYAGGNGITEATAVGKGAQATGKYSTAFGGSTQATAESALALGSSAHATGKGSVAAGLYAKAKVENGVALGKDSEATVDKGVVGYNAGEDAASTLSGNAWTSTLASVAIGKGAEKTRQLTGLAAGTADTDAVNVAQLKAAKVGVQLAPNSQLTLEKGDATAAGIIYTLDISKDGTIGGAKDGNLVTGTTVKTYVDNQITARKVTVEGDTAKGVTVTAAGNKYTVSLADKVTIGAVTIDGTTGAVGITGLTNTTWNKDQITSGRAATENQLKAVDDKADEAKAEAKKHTTVAGGTNVTVSETANTAGGKAYTVTVNADGTVDKDSSGIVTGGTVYDAIKGKADTATVNNIKTEIEGKLDNKAHKNLGNLDETGKTVVRDLAKESVKVVNGTNTTVEEGTEGKAKTYKVNVSNDAIKAAVAEDLGNKADKTALAGYARIDGSNITIPGTWATKLGIGNVVNDDKNLVTGGTVYNALQESLSGEVSASNTTKGVTGDKIKKAIDANTTTVKAADGSQVTVKAGTADANGTTYTVDISKDGTIGGAKDDNLVTGETVKQYVNGQITGSKVTVKAGDYATVTTSDDGKTYTVKGTTIEAGTDGHITVADKMQGDKKVGYTLSVKTDGKVKENDTGIVTGGTVYNAIKDKANNSLSNLTESGKTEIKTLAKQAVKVGNGTNTTVETVEENGVTTYKVNVATDGEVTDGNTGIVTGGTVYNAIKDKVNKADLSGYAKTDATNINADKWAEKLGTGTVAKDDKGLVTGDTVYHAIKDKANNSLSNITEAGKTEIKTLAKQAVKVGAGTNTTVETLEENGVTTYKVNVATIGKVEESDTGIVTGGTVYNAIKDSLSGDISDANTTKGVTGAKIKQYVDGQLAGNKVTVEAGNHVTVTPTDNADGSKKYTVAVKTDGTVTDGNTGIVTGGTVKAALDDLAGATNLTEENVNAWRGKLGNGKVETGNKGLVTGDTVHKAIEANKTTVEGDEEKGLTVSKAGNTYKVSLEDKVKVGAVSIDGTEGKETIAVGDTLTMNKDGIALQNGPKLTTTGVDAGSQVISNVADGKKKTDAVNFGQLGALADKVDAVIVEAKKHTTVEAGANVTITPADNADGSKKYTVALQDTLTGLAKVETKALSVGDVAIDDTGIHAGNRAISGVADGKAPTDAVNMRQLMSLGSEWNGRLNEVGAGAAALAALHPLDYDPDNKWDMAVGYGHYRGAHAASLGAYYRPNEYTLFTVGGSIGGGDNMVNVGISLKVGSGEKDGVIASKADMAKEIKALKAQNEAILEKSQKMEAENQDMKKELEELKAQVAQLLAK